MPLHPFWQQAFPAAPASPGKSRPPAFAFHPGAESVLTFARPFRWLISAFHKNRKVVSARRRAVIVGMSEALSISRDRVIVDLRIATRAGLR